MMLRRLFFFLSTLLLCMTFSLTYAESDLPPEIQDFFSAQSREGHSISSSVEIENYFFVVTKDDNGTNHLYGFKQKSGAWNYWLHTTSAIPQGTANLMLGNAQGSSDLVTGKEYTAPTLSVARISKFGDSFDMGVTYILSNGTWLLRDFYSKEANNHYVVYCKNNAVTYYSDINSTKPTGTVKATIQRDLRYVSLSSIPKSYRTAKEHLTLAPSLPLSNELVAQEIKFSGGKKYKVYSAPSKDSLRGGNGKAAVSTNSWIQVFGQEGDWILIQYSIDASHYRIGYIAASALPKNTEVPTLEFKPVEAWLEGDTSLTDDPFYSQRELAALEAEDQVTWLATIGEWAYIEVSQPRLMRGFVPINSLRTDHIFDLELLTDGLAEGNVRITAERTLYADISLNLDTLPSQLLITDDSGAHLGTITINEFNRFLCESGISLSELPNGVNFIPVYESDSVGTILFHIQW